jgi:hypothetical protein
MLTQTSPFVSGNREWRRSRALKRKASDRVTRGSRPGAPGEKPSISVIVPGPILAGSHPLEAAGIDFIEDNGGGEGVRFRKPQKSRKRI